MNRKQIGIFSGSFNPIHIGHLMLANYITEFTYIDEVWFVVTPHNPLKLIDGLADEKSRLRMCHIALQGMEKLKVSEIEFSMPKPSFTVDTLDRLKMDYPELDFILIIGADNWKEFHLWREYKRIIAENKILIYPRLGEKLEIAAKPQQKPQTAPQQENALPQENAGNGVMQENSSNDYLSGGDKGNPDTGAQDLSAVIAALAVVSLAGGLTLLKGKNK